MNQEPYQLPNSIDLSNLDQRCDIEPTAQIQLALRQGLLQQGNRDVGVRLAWMVNNCEKVRAAWMALEDSCESSFFPNVQEHAPPLAGASVDRGVRVKVTQEHVNRAASGGCVSRLVRLSSISY